MAPSGSMHTPNIHRDFYAMERLFARPNPSKYLARSSNDEWHRITLPSSSTCRQILAQLLTRVDSQKNFASMRTLAQ
eukprot:6203685-Pleurochrysis_carterae.AAC.8